MSILLKLTYKFKAIPFKSQDSFFFFLTKTGQLTVGGEMDDKIKEQELTLRDIKIHYYKATGIKYIV